jgi:Skp family chaperone for outer membrane proteins
LELQRKLDDERTGRQEEISTIRTHHESVLESEDKKYQRRLAALQERLNAKDAEYAQIFEK